jgi:glucoamylase
VLRQGAALATQIGELSLAGEYRAQAENVLCFMQVCVCTQGTATHLPFLILKSFWNPSGSYMTANTGGGRSGIDANTALASIHTFDAAAGCDAITFQPCSDKALSSLKVYVDTFRSIYSINHGIPSNEAVATGRYAEDVYFGGNVSPSVPMLSGLCLTFLSLGTSPLPPLRNSYMMRLLSGIHRDL